MQTILIQSINGRGEIRAQVPDNATVTFGGLIPGAKVDGGSNRTALRVYIGKKQIAVFTGVESFRFIDDVKVLEKREQKAVKSMIVQEGGLEKVKNITVATEEWVDPDAVKPSNVTSNEKIEFSNLLKEIN